MSEGSTSGYIPGSVWVPYSVSRPDQRRRPRARQSWLSRLLQRKRPSLYQRCLALHIMKAKADDRAETPS